MYFYSFPVVILLIKNYHYYLFHIQLLLILHLNNETRKKIIYKGNEKSITLFLDLNEINVSVHRKKNVFRTKGMKTA